MTAGYQIVQLAGGARTLYSAAYGEKMHPGLGPQAEAELLYVRQLRICERLRDGTGEFVIWDVGLGGAANATTTLRATREIARPLRLVSFDNSAEPLEFALGNADALGYLEGYEKPLRELLEAGTAGRTPQRGVPTTWPEVRFMNGQQPVRWEFLLGDFPQLLESQIGNLKSKIPAPDAIFYDAFSPAKNPAMWTLAVFTNLFRLLDPARPCALTTYSRSTMLRATLLLAGFYVGVGQATGLKEETTIAANARELIAQPLDGRWLERARRSDSAEPLTKAIYHKAPLSAENFEKLRTHPQFQ